MGIIEVLADLGLGFLCIFMVVLVVALVLAVRAAIEDTKNDQS